MATSKPVVHVEAEIKAHRVPELGWGIWLSYSTRNMTTGRLRAAGASWYGLPPAIAGTEVPTWDFVWGTLAEVLGARGPAWWTPFLKAAGMTPLLDDDEGRGSAEQSA